MLTASLFIYTGFLLASLGLCENITSLIESLPELSNLTAYLSVLPTTTLSLSSLQDITFLAPTNEAFVKLLNSSAGASIATGNVTDLVALLQYQTLNGTYKSHNFDAVITTSLKSSAYTTLVGGAAATYVPASGSFLSGLGVSSVPGVCNGDTLQVHTLTLYRRLTTSMAESCTSFRPVCSSRRMHPTPYRPCQP